MSALSKAVKFRALADKLDGTEYNTFLSNFLANCGRDIVLKWLFTQFTSRNSHHFSTQHLNIAVNDIENIIQSRESKPDQSQIEKTTINSLPDTLYREIASYLKDRDYIAFSKSNRSIFVSCNSPNSLKYLDLTSVQYYSLINLQNFPQIEHLKININKFHQFPLPPNGTKICNHLSNLTLFGDGQIDIDIDPFLDHNFLNITNVKQLNLRSFSTLNNDYFCHEKLCRLLSKFNMIRYLNMFNMYCNTRHIDNGRLMQLLPNLEGFSWNGGVYGTPHQFIGLYGDKLKALKFYNGTTAVVPTDASLGKLQDLMIWKPRISALNTILKTAQNLKKIQIYDFWPGLQCFDGDDWQNTMNKLLSQQKELEYIDIKVDITKFRDISEGLESGLYEIDRTLKDIKIKLTFTSESTVNARKIYVYIARILQQLSSSQIANFILVFKLCDDRNLDKEEWNKAKEKFINKNAIKYEIHAGKYMIAITNKQCMMNNGYLESWIIHQD